MSLLRRLSSAFLLLAASAAGAATFEQIPSPRPTGWVTDLTGTLPLQTVTELNRVGDQVKAQTGAEMAVVVVGTADGDSRRDLAARLLKAWEIGEPRGKGLLVFVSLSDQTTEIALGDGVRDAARVRESEALVRSEMAPRLKSGDAAGAVLLGSAACVQRLLGAKVTVAAPVGDPDSTVNLPTTDDPLPSTAVPDPQAGDPPAPAYRSSLLLQLGLASGALFALLAVCFKLLRHSRHSQQKMRLPQQFDPAMTDVTGSW
ncbi:MAG TPA: TPM domain-containing protein [Thermoanaerobaculia bacterium]|nr:TPM domain-containing protein [Thermoanaerobaculia bacterium]